MVISEAELAAMPPRDFCHMVRRGELTRWVSMACSSYAWANITIVPKEYAYEVLLFCNRNPRPCLVINVTEVGDPHPTKVAPEADLRTGLTKYKVFKNSQLVAEPNNITDYWRDDLVGFLIGCSRSFYSLWMAANIKYRWAGVFITNIQCAPAGCFRGPMVVSCRWFKVHDALRAIQITSRALAAHGPLVHIGHPAAIGIKDLCHADFVGVPPNVTPQKPDEIALYWRCGITPEMTVKEANLPLMITQEDMNLLVTDRLTEELTVL